MNAGRRVRQALRRAGDGLRVLGHRLRIVLPGPVRNAVLIGALSAAWYGFGAQAVGDWLIRSRAPKVPLRLEDLRARADDTPAAQTALLRFEAADAAETRWIRLVDSLLSPAERQDGLARAARMPPLQAAGGVRTEPELPALIEALAQRYGPATVDEPVRATTVWLGVDRRTRAKAVLALVRGPGLDPERAARLLGATQAMLQAEADRQEQESSTPFL